MESRPKLNNSNLRSRMRGPRRTVLLNRPHSAKFNGRISDVHIYPSQTGFRPPDSPSLAKTLPNPIAVAKGTPIGFGKVLTQRSSSLETKNQFMKGIAHSLKDKSPQGAAVAPSSVVAAPNVVHSKPSTTRSLTQQTVKPRPDFPKQERSNVLKRQMSKQLAYTHAKKHRRALVPTLLSGLAVTLFMLGILVVVNALHTDHTVKAQIKKLSQPTGSDTGITEGTPSEADPPNANANNSYQVSADLPRILTIDKIDVKARIRSVGVGLNNILKAPANIFDVGWYDGSAKPGENGTIVLDGHVSGPTKHGVFYSIGTLKVGDKVTLERGDGKKFTYSVTGLELFDNDKVDMNKVVTTSVAGKPGLNFMTCAGRFNVRNNEFEQRIVVYTVQD